MLTVMDGRDLTTPSKDKREGIIDASVNIDLWDTGFTDGETADLKIWTLPTTDILPKIKNCIHEWMKDGTDIDSMKRYIESNKLKA